MGPGLWHATACVECKDPFIAAFSFNSTNLFYQVIFLLSLLHTMKHSIIHVALSLFRHFTFFFFGKVL